MKIEKIKLFGFGKFSDKRISFSEKQLIFGENEAGKTTIYNFIKFMLFGFKAKDKTHRNFKPLDHSIYGGQLEISDGDDYYVIQRRALNGRSNKLEVIIEKNGQMISESEWLSFLAPINQDLFEKVYTVSQDNLELHAEKDMGEEELENLWRVTASTGTQELTEKIAELNKELPDLYKPAGKNPQINQKLTQIMTINQQIEQKIAENERFQPNFESIVQLNESIVQLQAQIIDLTSQVNRLRQQNDYQSDYESYQQLKSIDFSQILSDQAVYQLKELDRQLQSAMLIQKNIDEDLAQTEQILQSLQTKELAFYQQSEIKIDELRAEFPEVYGLLSNQTVLENQYIQKEEQRKNFIETNQLEGSKPYSNELLAILAKSDSQNKHKFSITKMTIFLVVAFFLVILLRNHLPLAIILALIVILIGYVFASMTTSKALKSPINFAEATKKNQQLQQLDQLNQELEELGSQLEESRHEIQFFANRLTFFDDIIFNADLLLKEKMQALEQFAQDSTMKLKQINLLAIEAKQHKQKLNQEQLKQLEQANPNYQKIAEQLENQKNLINQKAQFQLLKSRLEQYFNLAEPVDFSVLTQEMTEKQKRLSSYQLKLEELRNQKSQLTSEIQFLQTDGSLDNLYQVQSNLETEIQNLAKDWSVKSGLIELYQMILANLSEVTLPEILNLARNYFADLTNHGYCDLCLEKQVLMVETVNHQKLRVLDLSTGTKDQLLLALRLALIQSKGLNFPIFIDDAFLRYDKVRKARVFKLFEKYHESQLIIFTSDLALKSFFEANTEAVEVLN